MSDDTTNHDAGELTDPSAGADGGRETLTADPGGARDTVTSEATSEVDR